MLADQQRCCGGHRCPRSRRRPRPIAPVTVANAYVSASATSAVVVLPVNAGEIDTLRRRPDVGQEIVGGEVDGVVGHIDKPPSPDAV